MFKQNNDENYQKISEGPFIEMCKRIDMSTDLEKTSELILKLVDERISLMLGLESAINNNKVSKELFDRIVEMESKQSTIIRLQSNILQKLEMREFINKKLEKKKETYKTKEEKKKDPLFLNIESPETVKEVIAEALVRFGVMKREDICNVTGIKRTTVYDALSKMVTSNFLKKGYGKKKGRRGRPNTFWAIHHKAIIVDGFLQSALTL
jgi:hypothetical protein